MKLYMKRLTLMISCFLTVSILLGQAREVSVDGYKTYLGLVITEGDDEKTIIKEGDEISVRTEKGYVFGRWYFKDYPDVVFIKNKKGKILRELELNKQQLIRIAVGQSGPRLGIGIGVGPIGVSTGGTGSSYNVYSMKHYDVVIKDVLETREEKIKREYIEKKEEQKMLKVAKRQAKKDRKKKK